MSMVLCYYCDNYSIIATDTRNSQTEYNGEVSDFDDNDVKLHNLIHLGWAAGVGHNWLIKTFDYDGVTPYTDTAELMERAHSKMKEIGSNLHDREMIAKTDKDILEKYLDTTCIALSNRTKPFQIDIITGDQRTKRMQMRELYGLFPIDYINDPTKLRAIKSKYFSQLVPDNNLDDAVKFMAVVFQEVSKESPWVSDTCDIGIIRHMFTGEVVKYRLRKQVDEIINSKELEYKQIPMRSLALY
jgi:hypothetical protein